MATTTQQQQYKEGALLPLDAAIKAVDLAKQFSGIAPIRTVFDIVAFVLTTIRVPFSFSAAIRFMLTRS